MPPKVKGKKGRKQDDDDFWENAGETVAPSLAKAPVHDDEEGSSNPRGAFSAFSELDTAGAGDGEDEDFGGLMSIIKASSAKQKDKKKAKKGKADPMPVEDVEERPAEDAVIQNGHISPPPPSVQMSAEDLADEEWGKPKGKQKDKKGGKTQTPSELLDPDTPSANEKAVHPSEPVPKPSTPSAPVPLPPAEDEEDDSGPKVLSKKEKERLKKEREKAKKKAQADAKKADMADTLPEEPLLSSSASPVPAHKDEDEDEEGDGDEVAGDKKKKKKKKKKAVESAEPEEKKEESKIGKKTKVSAAIAALRAAQEAQRLAEEEAKRQAEEERKRQEEEERRLQEEERLREEAKLKKKEKEKAKKEQAKKEGRYLTKKQKEEKAAAEARMKSLIESGVRIEGLQSGGGSAKKASYPNRKKKGAASTKEDELDERAATPTSPLDVTQEVPSPVASIPVASADTVSISADDDEVKDSWDVSDQEPATQGDLDEAVKDDWDASSGEETEPAKPLTPEADESPANGEADKSSKPATNGVAKAEPAVPSNAVHESKPVSVEENTVEDKLGLASTTASADVDETEDESEDDDDSNVDLEESSEDGMTTTQRIAAQRKAEAAERRAKRHEEALAARNKDDLRSPICCILGHVDTGKTKLLDKIRQTNVQEGEAGGITQQIGATYFPVEAIRQKTLVLNRDGSQEYKIPGVLIIDTPGHESFTNLRTRGSSLCNIAILVVDIMHGLEPQTLESLRLLRDKKTPFIVALNKIDRLYGWTPTPDGAFQESLSKQKPPVQREFQDRVQKIILAFAEQGLNSVLYYENKRFDRNVSIVPTSAITGEGIPDMIMLLVKLTQERMSDRLMYLSELECTVLEVKVIEGLGTTIDVVLSNGVLHEGDRIVLCGLDGPISTQVRALLTPQPLRELRIKSAYVHHKEVKAALGVKITAPGLEKAIAGSRLLVVGPDDDEDDLRDEVMSDLTSLLNNIDKSGKGVCVQSSTLGSLEALLDFLKSSKIPVSGINIGPVHKKDVMRAAIMLERARELACILCFDVTVDKEAEKLAEELGVRLFKADIIYHLFDAFTAYNAEMVEAKRRDAAPQAIWPCRLKTIAVFAKRDPIILGVDILDGSLRVGTPICVVKVDPVTQKKEIIDLGKITSMEINHKSMEVIKKAQAGGGVAVKIEHAVYQSAKMYGRHFDDKDELLSHVTRASIDILKETFREDVSKEEWKLIVGLKQRLDIQ